MANVVKATVTGRLVSITADHGPIIAGNVGVDYVSATFDSGWDGLTIYCVYACGDQAVALSFDTSTENEIPHEVLVPGELRLAFVGYDTENTEVIRTAHMRKGIPVNHPGRGIPPKKVDATIDVVMQAQQRLDALEEEIPDAKAATIAANAAAESASSAAEAASTAATAASSAASAAATAAESASESAIYAKSEGDAAKTNAEAAETAAEAATAATTAATEAAQKAETAASVRIPVFKFVYPDLHVVAPTDVNYGFRIEDGDLKVIVNV